MVVDLWPEIWLYKVVAIGIIIIKNNYKKKKLKPSKDHFSDRYGTNPIHINFDSL